jgi:hypothetical protein
LAEKKKKKKPKSIHRLSERMGSTHKETRKADSLTRREKKTHGRFIDLAKKLESQFIDPAEKKTQSQFIDSAKKKTQSQFIDLTRREKERLGSAEKTKVIFDLARKRKKGSAQREKTKVSFDLAKKKKK